MPKNKKEKFDSKNVIINKEELSITKIGEMTTSEQNPIFIFFLFGVLLVFIFFLPTIVNYFNKEDEKPDYSVIDNKTGHEKEENPNENEDVVFYTFGESLSIPLEDTLLVQNFHLEGNTLSFTITNKGDSRFHFNQKNYFLETYTEENTLLERVILAKESISKETSVDFSYPILESTAANMKKIRFIEKEIADYPNITLEKNDANEEVLVCTNNKETLTYKFKDQKLFSITDVVNYSLEDNGYNTKLEEWKNKSALYNTIGGISSTFIEAGNGFIVNTVLDLANAKLNNVNNEHYYSYETLGKVVKFEMEARGFSCK